MIGLTLPNAYFQYSKYRAGINSFKTIIRGSEFEEHTLLRDMEIINDTPLVEIKCVFCLTGC
jgi:hypothetical protein